jgi:hypothetical protein
MTIYLRRNGGMIFWRIGRVGGSFYLAASATVDDETRSIERALKAQRRANMRRDARDWHRYGAHPAWYN